MDRMVFWVVWKNRLALLLKKIGGRGRNKRLLIRQPVWINVLASCLNIHEKKKSLELLLSSRQEISHFPWNVNFQAPSLMRNHCIKSNLPLPFVNHPSWEMVSRWAGGKESKILSVIYTHIRSSIHNSRKVEATGMSADVWMVKQNVENTHNGVWFSL